MPEEALANGQVGQPASPEPQGGIESSQGSTIQPGGQSAPETEQPLTLTQSQLSQMIRDAMAAEKQNWLNEAYQNTQSMNDKFEARVNATISAFEKAGIKTDKVSAAKYLREQDKLAQANAQAQRQAQPQAQASRLASQVLLEQPPAYHPVQVQIQVLAREPAWPRLSAPVSAPARRGHAPHAFQLGGRRAQDGSQAHD